MGSLSVREFANLRAALVELRDELAQHVAPYGHAPVPGSIADLELQAFPRAESVHTASSQAWMLLDVTADQLTAFLKTVSEPFETIAPYTCIRSLLEAAALASWILDPTIDVRTRVSRSLALRYEGLVQQLRWAKAAGKDPIKAERRLDHIVAVANTLGYAPVNDRRGRVCGAGRHMPSVTDLVGEMLQEEVLYRLLSAVAHGHHWAIHQLSFTKAPQFDTVSAISGTKLTGLTKGANIDSMALLILVAASTFARAVWYKALYLGWDRDLLRTLLEERFDRLGAADHLRCWRIDSVPGA